MRCLLAWHACTGFVAFGAPRFGGMEEQQRIAAEPFKRGGDDIAGAHQPGMSLPDAAFRLLPALTEPAIGEGEARAAVIVLGVADTRGETVSRHGDEFRQTVWHTRKTFCQMYRGVCVVSHAQQQDLPVQLM